MRGFHGRTLRPLVLAAIGALGAAVAPPALCAQEAPAPAEEARTTETASAEVVERLLQEHATAAKAKDARAVHAVLVKMRPYDNTEFGKPALDALKYKASSGDKKAAKAELAELGMKGKDEIEKRLLHRESEVRAAGARVLANLPPETGVKALSKALKDKRNQKERPAAIASIIDALGRLGERSVEGEVEDLFQRFSSEEISRAAVLYFGRVKTKDLGIVLMLCDQLTAPQPANVDSASNPPAGYWEVRWKMWMAVRRDVSWALKEITGQVFAPAEGDHAGDGEKARAWVKDNARKLGLR